jgi:hypothetical protein
MFCTTSSTWKFVVVLGLSVAVPELSFSLGADVQIQGCRGKKLQLPRLCVFSKQIQYKRNMEAPVFESARASCYFTA